MRVAVRDLAGWGPGSRTDWRAMAATPDDEEWAHVFYDSPDGQDHDDTTIVVIEMGLVTEEIVGRVEEWCRENRVRPGQLAGSL